MAASSVASPSIAPPQRGGWTHASDPSSGRPSIADDEAALQKALQTVAGGEIEKPYSPPAAPDTHGPDDQTAFQQQIFSSFAGGVDAATGARLSSWLPKALGGDPTALKDAAKGLTAEQARDLNALAASMGLETAAVGGAQGEAKGGLKAVAADAVLRESDLKSLQQMQQLYGEHALTASTPGLTPTMSYDTGSTIDATRQAVFDRFTQGLDAESKARVETWLPALVETPQDSKAMEKLWSKGALEKDKAEDLKALAELHGLDGDRALGEVVKAYQQDVALATTGELPSVVDLMLNKDHGETSSGGAASIDLGDGDFKKAIAEYEQSAFKALDGWLPAALAGRGGAPTDDPQAMALLGRFAERMGMKGGADASPEQALDYLKDNRVLENTLHPGRAPGEEKRNFLLFSDQFLDSTLKYGAANGALSADMAADASAVAETLLGPGDGAGAPGQVSTQALMAAVLHRTDQPLARQQEIQAAAGYINKAGTLGEQKSRLAESLLAFHVREEAGTPPMTAQQWATSYEQIHPDMLDELGGRVFNTPTSEKMQIITQHLGVPGDHTFMIDKKRKIKIENDELGNVQDFDMKKKKKSFFKKLLDVAVPVVGAALSLTGVGAGAGLALNAAYGAYKGAEAIKNGDLMGGLLGMASAIPGGGMVAKGAQLASGALRTYQAIEAKDWMGALAGGLGTMGMGANVRGFQTAANGVSTAQAFRQGDFLQAGAGMAGLAGDASAYGKAGAGTQFAFRGLEQGLNVADGIQERNFAGIGAGAAGLIGTGGALHQYQQAQAALPPENGVGGRASDKNGERIIRDASYPNQAGGAGQRIEIEGGDTLSRIAERHGTTVDALLAANPDITDPGRIYAGQALTLPDGVQPVGAGQQQRLRDFADSQGGPSPMPGNPAMSPAEGAAAMADAELGVAVEVYKREFDQTVDQELSSIDRQIADIDRQLDEGVNHAPVAYHLKNERLKLMAQQRDLRTIADDPNAAFEALRAQKARAEEGWTASDIGHLALDVIGLAPIVGEWADAFNAGWYFKEGDFVNGGFSAAAAAPGLGIGATVGKWLGKAADGAALARGAELDGVTTEALDLLRKEGHGAVADIAERELRYLGQANVETSARIEKLLNDPGIDLSAGARSRLDGALNNLNDHLKSSDLIGAVRDNNGLPVLNPGKSDIAGTDVYYQHLDEVDNGLRSLRRAQRSLQDDLRALQGQVAGPGTDAAISQISSTLDAVKEMTRRIENLKELR